MFFLGDPLIFLPVAAERLRRPRACLFTDTLSLMLPKRGTDRNRPTQIIDLSVMLGESPVPEPQLPSVNMCYF